MIDKLDHDLKQINTTSDALRKNFNELTELKFNLAMTQGFFQQVDTSGNAMFNDIAEESVDENQRMTSGGMKLG